jgi:site-specific DNA-adenine methylase
MTLGVPKIPFPYFGGKRRVAQIIWKGLGQIENYIEPFCGGLSILLSSPYIPKIETINDIDAGLTNFFRAVSHDPLAVAKFADYPVSELDLHARHRKIVSGLTQEFIDKLDSDPSFYNSEFAGFYAYGISASIGNNWLQPKGLKALPLLSFRGGGIQGAEYDIEKQFSLLQNRLRKVRMCCGDYKRLLVPLIAENNKGISKKGITGIVLDPPYDQKARERIYRSDTDIFVEVRSWAIANGGKDRLRIVLCGYDQEDFSMPPDWQSYHWSASGGMASLGEGQGKVNAKKETIWFSPNCLKLND